MTRRHLDHDWFSYLVPENVILGERTWLYSSFAFIHYQSRSPIGLSVGHDSGLYHGTFFDLGPHGTVQVGDYCSLVGAVIATNHRVLIGDYALIAHEVVIADHDYWCFDIESECAETLDLTTRDIVIGENVWIGARAIILGGSKIGDGAIIGAATVVRGEVPPYTVYAGNPGRAVGHLRAK
jgi:acetyltransferase-like isoleucine patch superfamily enzyme